MVLRSRGRLLPLLFRPVRRYRKLDRKTNHTRIDHSIDTWGDETLDFAQAEETRDALNEERPLFEDRDLGANTFEWRDPVFDEDPKHNSEVPMADDDVASLEGLLGGPYESETLAENRQVKKKDGLVHLKYSITRENSTGVNKWSTVRNIFANRVQPNRKVPKKESHPWRQKVMNTPRMFSNNNLSNEKDKTGDILRYLRDGGRTKERSNDECFVVSQEDPRIAQSYNKSEVPKQKRSGFGIQNFMKNRRRDLRRKMKMKETAIDDLSEASDISGSEVISVRQIILIRSATPLLQSHSLS